MILNLSDLSSEPLQGQIVRQIRAKILSGLLPSGSDLPSIRGLARQQQISFITVQRAYESLVSEGLIRSRRGKGYFVSELSENGRKEMANIKTLDKMKIVIHTAYEEGLNEKELRELFEKIVREK